MESKKSSKKRNWAFVLYPESAPDDWQQQLAKTGLQCAISPLHDKDVNPDGEVKKAHYHIIICYNGPTSFNVVNSLCDSLNQPIPQPLEQIRGYYRYLTHKDNPEKFQYSDKDIKTINGFNITDFVELTKSEVISIKKRLQQLIRDKNFLEYSDFIDFLSDGDCPEDYEVATNHTYFFDRYISSRRNKLKSVKFNPETGEVIE